MGAERDRLYESVSEYIIRIHDYDHSMLSGLVKHAASAETFRFRSLMGLIMALNRDMDRRGLPYADYNFRTWNGVPLAVLLEDLESDLSVEETDIHRPITFPVANFCLKVRFRQNADWQGELIWMDRQKTICFRSIAELLVLIQAALLEADRVRESEWIEQLRWVNRESVS